MRHLLEKAGVHSALIHDKIVNESKEDRADIQLIEDESNAIAERAAAVLKRSYKQHRNFVELACVSSSNRKIFGQKKATEYLNNDNQNVSSSASSSRPSRSTSPSNDDDSLPSMFNGGMKRRSKDSGIDDSSPSSSKGMSSSELGAIIKRRRHEQVIIVFKIKLSIEFSLKTWKHVRKKMMTLIQKSAYVTIFIIFTNYSF